MTNALRRPLLLHVIRAVQLLVLAGAALTLPCISVLAATSGTLASDAKSARPLAVGSIAPDALVRSPDGTAVPLATTFATKPTVLVFYRGGWCPYCNRQLAELATFEAQFISLGFQILALSTDAPERLTATATKNTVAYRLLSDRAMSAASAYGVAFRVDSATVEKYRGYKIDLASVPGEPTARWLPVPAVFVIGRDRVIRFVASNPDYTVRLPAAELLAAAKAAASN